MADNSAESDAHNPGGCTASDAIHGHINDFQVFAGLRAGVSELKLPDFTTERAEITLMADGTFAIHTTPSVAEQEGQ